MEESWNTDSNFSKRRAEGSCHHSEGLDQAAGTQHSLLSAHTSLIFPRQKDGGGGDRGGV